MNSETARSWKVEGKDGFEVDADYYPLSEHPSYLLALTAARQRLTELNTSQSNAGGQDGIQDRVYIVHPDGTRKRIQVYDEPVELSYDEAVALLPDGDTVHTILNPGKFLIGADWNRESVLTLLRESPRREVTGPQAQSMNHGLCAYEEDGRPVFIETRTIQAVSEGEVPS